MAIQFADVPSNATANNVFVEKTLEKRAVGLQKVPQRIALIGQGLNASLFSNGDRRQVFSAGEVGSLYGFGSEIHAMSKTLFQNSGSVEVIAFPLKEAGADTAATGNILFAGTATAAGEIAIYIAGTRIVIPVAVGNTAANIVTAIVAANPTDSVVTLAANGVTPAQLDITAKWKGLSGNDITIAVNREIGESLPAGISSAVITAMASGAGVPDVKDALDEITADEIITFIVHPFTDAASLTKIEAFEDVRWAPDVKQGFASITAKRGDYAAVVTSLTSTRNSWTSCIIRNASPELSSAVAAAVTGQIAKSAGQDPSLQFNKLTVNGITAPLAADRWNWTVRNNAVLNGCSTLTELSGKVVIDMMVNTYQTTAQATDAPLVDRELVSVTLMTAIVYDRNTSFSLLWSRAKLANDGVIVAPGQKVMTPSAMKQFLINRYNLYLSNNWVEPIYINQSTGEVTKYADTIIAERNITNPNRIDVQDQIFRIGNLRVAAFKLGYDFAI